jgi:hypothetical protein
MYIALFLHNLLSISIKEQTISNIPRWRVLPSDSGRSVLNTKFLLLGIPSNRYGATVGCIKGILKSVAILYNNINSVKGPIR